MSNYREPMETDPIVIASMWWSVMTWIDPGMCMYAFGSTGCVQSEEHRADLLRYIDEDCMPACACQYDPETSKEELMILREYIARAAIAKATGSPERSEGGEA